MLDFSQNKEANSENLFKKQSNFTPPRNRGIDLDHQIDVLNNLNLEKMETKSKSNLSNKEQKELSKLTSNETIVIKSADKGGGAVRIFSTGHYQSMIMQSLTDENTYKKLDCEKYRVTFKDF